MITAEDKKTILHFLNKADSLISGYKSPYTELEDTWNFELTQSNDTHTGSAASESHSGVKIDHINEKITQCTRCPLAKTRSHTVPGEGSINPLVLVIGEGPGADEDPSGRPFVGKAGQLLDKMLIAIDLSRNTNTYITNIVKCRPPQNRDPLPEEAQACRSFLDLQIQLLKPKMILAIGRVSVQNLLGCKEAIENLRGKFFEYKDIPLMATYHPSALLRDESLKRPAWEDLKLFRTKLNEILNTEGR
jgi:DNA polymerase